VFVTAQRISQPASKIPVSLTVLSGEELKAAGAINASSLTDLVPNVQISNNGGATVISIRGVSSSDTTEKGDPSASFNIDGVNLGRPQSAGLGFFDLERVEVLRGPQGTLYGRNATAGAINLITNKPVDHFESSAAVEFGNYNGKKFDGMINSKIGNILSVRAAVSSSKHDGYLLSTQKFSANQDDDNSLSGRFQGLFKFTPDLSLLVSTDASLLKGAGAGGVPYTTFISKSGDEQRTATPSVQSRLNDKAHGESAEFKARTGVGRKQDHHDRLRRFICRFSRHRQPGIAPYCGRAPECLLLSVNDGAAAPSPRTPLQGPLRPMTINALAIVCHHTTKDDYAKNVYRINHRGSAVGPLVPSRPAEGRRRLQQSCRHAARRHGDIGVAGCNAGWAGNIPPVCAPGFQCCGPGQLSQSIRTADGHHDQGCQRALVRCCWTAGARIVQL
jgi:iron complex outermembrane receptor protein